MKTTLFPKAFVVPSFSILLLGLAVPDLDAAVVTNLYAGASSTNIASFSFDGDAGSYLEISGGFQMTNASALFGNLSTTKGVNGLVSGNGTYWQAGNGNWFDVGTSGSGNTLTFSNGATVLAPGLLVGRNLSASNNTLVLSGSGTTVTNPSFGFYVGYNASGERLVLRDGARFFGASGGTVGFLNTSASSNNLIQVSGTGTLFRTATDVLIGGGVGTWGNQVVVDSGGLLNMPSANLEVGSTGSGSSLLVTNGGHGQFNAIHVSKTSTSSNNTVLISGAGSTVTNGSIYMGYVGGRDGQVVVSNSGSYSAGTVYMGWDIASKGQKLTAVSTGSVVASQLFVGYSGSSNIVTISGGGVVNAGASDSYIGFNASSSNNAMIVTSGGQFLKSSADLDVGYNGVNNLLVVSNGGVVNLGNGNLYVAKMVGSSGNTILTGAGSKLSVGSGQYVLTGSNTYGRGMGSIIVSDGATLSSGNNGLEAGFAGTGVISNNGGVYEFISAAPTIKPNTAGAISLNNGWVSFKNVANVAIDGQITNIAYTGANSLRLDSSTNASLSYYAFTNGGRFSTLELVNGNPLWQSTGLLIGNGGTLRASNALATVSGVLTNAGTVSVVNGQLTYLNSVVLNGGTFSLQNATNQFNQGLSMASGSSLTVTGGTTRMTGAITNTAGTTIQALNSVVSWAGPVVIGGRYYSDPSTNIFNTNVTVTASGSLYGSNGDLFVFERDLVMQSTNRAEFNLVNAAVLFTNAAFHNLNLTDSGALDKGSNWLSVADLATNFAIGTLSIASGNKVVVQGGAGTNALYVGWLDLQGIQTDTYAHLTNGIFSALGLPSINMYYDEHVGGNAYLQGQTYNLWGGSLLIPIPEPDALLATASGIALLLFLRRRQTV